MSAHPVPASQAPEAAAPRVSVFAAETPTLPSGAASLSRELVIASQRQRLVHGVTIAVADRGFAAATIADITDRAGVSKKTFYEHFADKTTCFLAAYDHGSAAILDETAGASSAARAAGLPAVEQLRAGTRAYLDFLVFEEPYARTFCLEMLAAGPTAIVRHRACREAFAGALATWHAVGRAAHPGWPDVPALTYEAATGVVHEISSARVADGRAAELPALCDELLAAQLTQLGIG
jgi:AcrR family transcriptional regulator